VDASVLKAAALQALDEIEDSAAGLGLALETYTGELEGEALAHLVAALRAVAKRLQELRAALPDVD
jgi:hypothetical protein